MKQHSPNHPAVRYYTEHNIAPSNRNAFMRRRRGAALMAVSLTLIPITLFGGWAWTGRHFGVVMFCAVPISVVSLFLLATDWLETPLEK